MNRQVNIYTLREYLKLIGIRYSKKIKFWYDLSDYLADKTEGGLIAYPIYEIDYVFDSQNEIDNICLVKITNTEYAFAEI